MAFVDVALLVGAAVGLEGTAAVVGGGALIGAGVGGGYSAITGDGNILNSMLTGAAIGGAGAYGIGSMGAGEAATQAAMAGPFFGGPTTAPVAAGVGGGGGGAAGGAPALTASQTAALNSTNVAELNALSAKAGLEAGAGSGLMAAPNIITPQIMAGSGAGSTTAGLSGTKMLGYGLAGTTALQLLGNQNRSSAGGGYKEDEYDKRLKGYKLSPNYQPSRASQPSPYYRPTYAAVGGIMNSNIPHSFDDETGSDNVGMAAGGFNMANGGMTSLGGYSDGGRMLKGPGDGMSDSIPGVIGGKQPARLADGEFVVPADVVSHLGNGSTDAGAKRLYSMMDNIRQARTGKKKQAPEINVDKYLPVKKASGGIAGYAEGGVVGYATGGEIAAAYEAVLGRAPDEAGLAYWASTGASAADIAKAMAASPEAKAYQPTQVQKIFNEQLGRGAEQTALDFYSKALASGQSAADVAKGIAQSKEGQDMDIQAAASAYRQALGRNPEPAGLQYWLSVAQSQGLTSQQLRDSIKSAAVKEQTARNITKPFDNMQLNSLESDPLAGYYSDYSIYDIAPDAENVSMIGDRKVQFRTPVTQQAVVSNFIDGVYSSTAGKDAYTATPGKDILNMPHIQAAINVARANGTMNEVDYKDLSATLNTAKTAADIRAALAKPQGQVVVDAIYGHQMGEAKTLLDAQAEAAKRQTVLSKQDPGYYQSNNVLTDAYKAAGVSIPADYSFYKGVDTRDRTSNLLTPENLIQKRTDLVNTLNRDNPYRVAYTPTNRGIANMPPSVQDPYSDEGLKFLYGQMMNQYGPPPASFVNPATFTSEPYRYIPPPQNNLTLKSPIPDASKPATPVVEAAPAPAAPYPATQGGDRAGGLMSINRKKRRAA
jgi:hypothetical protein